MPTPIILDCDPGLDDAIAILMAVASPEVELLAITCVAGNVSMDNIQDNARRLLTLAGAQSVPVAAGLDRPLLRPLVTASHVHGENGLGGVTLPAPTVELDPRHGVDLLVETIMAAPRPITLVPTGPLSNIAMALRREPRLRDHIARITLMGGGIAGGNVTPRAEFNIYVDPDAARIVFSSGIPITMVGLDVTHKATVGPADVRRIRALGTPVGDAVAAMLDFYARCYRDDYGTDELPLHDPCCVAEVIQPGLITTKRMNVEIETASELTLGETVCDVLGVSGRTPNADVGVDLDRQVFVDILMDCLRRYT